MHANQFVRSMKPFAAVSHIWVFISIYDSHHSIPQVDLIFSPRCINRLHRQRRGWKHNSGNQRAVGWEQADAHTKEFRPAPHLEVRRASSCIAPLKDRLLTYEGLQSCNLLTAWHFYNCLKSRHHREPRRHPPACLLHARTRTHTQTHVHTPLIIAAHNSTPPQPLELTDSHTLVWRKTFLWRQRLMTVLQRLIFSSQRWNQRMEMWLCERLGLDHTRACIFITRTQTTSLCRFPLVGTGWPFLPALPSNALCTQMCVAAAAAAAVAGC